MSAKIASSKILSLGAALVAMSLLAACGDEQNPQSKTQNLDGAADQPSQSSPAPAAAPSQAMESQGMESSSPSGETLDDETLEKVLDDAQDTLQDTTGEQPPAQ